MSVPAFDSSAPMLPPLGGRPTLGLSLKNVSLQEETAAKARAFPSGRMTFLFMLILTGLGAFLRFWRLDHQSYWCDETATIERVCDSFDHMVVALGNQAFPPGWYVTMRWWLHVMQWWTGSEGQAFQPQYMRIVPAALGTLMVPSMYLLARQFTDRRGALLVMLLTAVNPFLIYYSRDVKMYAALYFLISLHVGLFFQWLAVERWPLRNIVVWPLMALTGVAMLSLHNIAWFIVGLELIWVLTHRRLRPMTGPLWVLSVGMMAVLPVWWQLSKSDYLTRALAKAEGLQPVRQVGSGPGDDLGLGWIQRYTDMSWHTIIGLPTTHIAGFLWPEDPVTDRMKDWFNLGNTYQTLPWLEQTQWYVGVGLLAILFAGLLPWRVFEFSAVLWRRRLAQKGVRWKLLLLLPLACTAVVLRLKGMGLQALPGLAVALTLLMAPGLYWIGFRQGLQTRPVATRWRAWWIALWIFVPVTLFACTWLNDNAAIEIRIAPPGAAPATDPSISTITGTITKIVAGEMTLQTDKGTTIITTANARFNGQLRIGTKVICTTNPPWHIPFTNWSLRHDTVWGTVQLAKVWEPRYLGIVLPAFLLWLGMALRRLPTWPIRTLAIAAVVCVCTLSALCNHLAYRLAPYQQTAELVKKYIDPAKKDQLAYGMPAVEFASSSAQYPFVLDLGGKILPQSNANRMLNLPEYDKVLPVGMVDTEILDAPGEAPPTLPRLGILETNAQFLQRVAARTRNPIQTIVLTDRVGGGPNDLLSDDAAMKILGADKWELKETELNPWYYEWRFYIYHVWRTRVWVRKPAKPA